MTQEWTTWLAAPAWVDAAAPAGGAAPRQHLVLAELAPGALAELQSQLPGSRCIGIAVAASATPGERYAQIAQAYFEAVRELLLDKPQGPCLVQLVTDEHSLLEGLSGLIDSASLENPLFAGQVIAVDAGLPVAALASVLLAERGAAHDRVVRHAGGRRQVRRWGRIDESAPAATLSQFKEHGCYLVTGGLGGLGVLVAREILAQSAGARVVLVGRGAVDGAKRGLLESLQAQGRVEYRQADIGDAAQVESLVAGIVRENGALHGIVHSAGVLDDDFIVRKSPQRFSAVLRPKVSGSEHLDHATRGMALDFLVLFSSIASWAGNVGQADYAAANGFMEAFAGWRNRLVAAGERAGRTLAIGWPHWRDGGMAIDAHSLAQLEQRTGLRSMDTATGMAALRRGLALPHPQLMVMHGDAAGMTRALAVPQAMAVSSPAPAKHAAVADLPARTREFLRQEFATVLKVPAHRIEPRAALENYGIDSILAMNLTSQLEASFGALPKTLFFEYQTLDELAGYFTSAHAARLNALFAPAAASEPAAASPASTPAGRIASRRGRSRFLPVAADATPSADPGAPPAHEPIAIVGLSGRYPESRDLESFWRNLRDGRDCIVEVPAARWDWREHYSADRSREGAHYSKWGGFIEGVDEFDPRFFNIAPRDAAAIDPQERLFLQHAWMAIEDAGYTRASLQMPGRPGQQPGQVGVYAGVMYGEYNLSGSLAGIANRVSWFLNLHGPSLTLDTMCSSSLTALHLACQDLRAGRTNLALAGGVNVSVHPNKYTMLSGGQFISGDGHCQSFGEGGDGYIPGEGVGVAVLKRLSDAERDGNAILGVIRGSALNHGGKTNGYTVPNPQAQADVIRRALAEAGVEPRHVSYIEAHGTGTKLGDPIEIAALTRAFREGLSGTAQDNGFCLIGSAKSNIGHCESAAGIAGVTKVLLQMKHGAIVPSLHSRKLNPHIDFGSTPFSVVQQLQPWARPVVDGRERPRIAGISSFGAGGSNAHVIVEEYRGPVAAPAAVRDLIVPLSARSAEQLRQRCADLLVYLEGQSTPSDLPAVAWTLQIGREAMEERVAFIVDSTATLLAALRRHLAGKPQPQAWRDAVKPHKEAIAQLCEEPDFDARLAQWIERRDLAALAPLWARGLEIDWRRVGDGGTAPRLLSLPAYPFARERHWQAPATSAGRGAATRLHPLVHENTSTLAQPGYRSAFRPDDECLEPTAQPGVKELPPLRMLDAMRAAATLAWPRDVGAWEPTQLAWGEPFLVGADRVAPLEISLFPRGDDLIDVELHSGSGDTAQVHAQGRAVFGGQPASGVPITALPAAPAASMAPVVPVAAAPVASAVAATAAPEPGLVSAKPTQVRLGEAPPAVSAAPVEPKGQVRLAPLSVHRPSPLRRVELEAGWHEIEWQGPLADAVAALPEALRQLRDEPGLKLLSLAGTHWQGGRETVDQAIDAGVFRALAEFPCPVLAVVHGRATGAGLLLAAACDFLVLDGEAVHGYTDAAAGLWPSAAEDRVFRARLGDALADDLLYRGLQGSGWAWRAKGWACSVAAPAEVAAEARRLAELLRPKSRLALELLKTHLAREIAPALQALQPVGPQADAAPATQDSVLTLHLVAKPAGKRKSTDPQVLVPLLKTAIERAAKEPALKALVLTGAADDFLPGTTDAATLKALMALVRHSPVPVIAALEAGASAAGWLFALACDAAVYRQEGRHAAGPLWAAVARDATVLATQALGAGFGAEVAWSEAALTGTDLQDRAPTLAVAAGDAVLAEARRLGTQWAAWPREALGAWKQAQAQRQQARIDALPQPSPDTAEETAAPGGEGAPTAVALSSPVVSLSVQADGVAVVTMHDRDAKNMFSAALVAGLREAFDRIDAGTQETARCKAVVLTGYDSFFATGGTRETLLAIQQGQAQFTDEKIFQRPMDCRLPVIAAIQGHGIGGGWSFGMFADLVLLAEESRYLSPYMGYGFTPGAGSTLMFPARIGLDLARETLMGAQEVSGLELKARGLLLPVLPRRDVLPQALALAARLARQPRGRLQAWKALWSQPLRAARDDTYQRELAMHERTFVRNEQTLQTIEARFAGEAVAAVKVEVKATAPAAVVPMSPAALAGPLKAMLAQELFLQADEIDEDTPFIELGLDSITGVTWIRKINAQYGTALEATQVYSHPTVRQLAALVAAERGGVAAAPTPAPAAVVTPAPSPIAEAARRKLVSWRQPDAAPLRLAAPASNATSHTTSHTAPIAVIGMAGQFPKARDVDAFWANLAAGRDCIDEVPARRWRVSEHFQPGAPTPGKTSGKWLGALDEHECFDPLFFSISPTEAECMDPQQRLFLQACWHAIEHAGHSPASLSGSACGVFVGCGPSDYHQAAPEQQLSAQGFTGAASSILAARISYFLNLQGPCLAIETACSSSLVAMATACDSLNNGHSDLALAGGVYVMAGPAMHIMTSQAGMLSADGRCFSFDQRANGFVPGEAVGVVLLKRLADAERDGDRILGVIEGWGVNQDGKTNGITAPNEESQTRLLRTVYRRFGIDPAGIQLVEAHGTGTRLGDPIEVAGLKAAFRSFTDEAGHPSAHCALGSVKSNIGHCLTAAGAAGVIKLLQAIKHRALPPTIHYERCNEHIRLDGSPFYVNDRLQPWTVAAGVRRRAAVSSFGFSGTNAHLVIAEHLPATPAGATPALPLTQDGRLVLPLSARTEPQLREVARRLLARLRAAEPIDFDALAYTLQQGRDAMGERLGFLAGSAAELVTALEAWLAGNAMPEAAWQGQVKRHRDGIRLIAQDEEMKATIVGKWLAERKLSKLVDLWVKGLDLDWSQLWSGTPPVRAELPPYPFARERLSIHPQVPEEPAASEPDDTVMVVPRWDVLPAAAAPTPDAAGRTLVLGAPQDTHAAWAAGLAGEVEFIDLDGEEGADTLQAKLAGTPWTRLVWVAGAHAVQTLAEDHLLDDPQRGLLQGLRIARALVQLGHERRPLAWDLVTQDSLAVHPQARANPTHAGLQGLAGSLADAFPHWTIRHLDLQQVSAASVAAMRRLPVRQKNACYLRRGDEWFAQVLVPASLPTPGGTLYRQGGVYVAIGGSGGIGEVWTRHVIEQHRAQVVWIGRRALDDAIRRKLDAMPAGGPQPVYLQADASRPGELLAACEQVRARFGAIHGVLHSAVGAFDQGLKVVTDDAFRAVLSAKVDLGVRIAQVVADLPLDFLLVFSSNASFERGAGMAGYSAGCAFNDAHALQLGLRRGFPVKVVNWGYWSVGAGEALSDSMKTYFHEMGYRPLDAGQAMAALDRFMASRLGQVSIGRNLPLSAAHFDAGDEGLAEFGAASTARLALDAADIARMDLAIRFERIPHKAGQEMEALAAPLLRGLLQATPDVLPKYRRWLGESHAIIEAAGAAGLPPKPLPQLWAAWDEGLSGWVRDPGRAALCRLVDTCLRALPDILAGRRKATDIIFPNSSLEFIENVYKTEAASLLYNESLRDTLATVVAKRLQADPAARLRLLEIGAGTGATTVNLIAALAPYQDRIAEYCYTDLSKAFLFHAESVYAPRAPYLRTRIFNVEQPVAPQGIEPGAYDIVIAANVIHATRNIRNAVRNAKALLRPDGLLMLNEISEKSVSGHLTFGLLDGWWLNEDDDVRIPGSPGLYPEAWQRVLEGEGFHSVRFPCEKVHALGQQIVVASSDGVIRQRRQAVVPLAAPVPVAPTPAPVAATPVRTLPAADLHELTVQFCKQVIGGALKIDVDQIDAAEPLESYGIDSIIVGLVNQQLHRHFGELGATLLYEHQTVEALARHLAATRRDELMRLFAPELAAPAASAPVLDVQAVEQRPAPAAGPGRERQPIAIVGLSGRYAQAPDLQTFWDNLKAGRDCVTEIPADRWPLEGFYEPDEQRAVEQGRSYCKWGSFLDTFAEFDALFFGIPPKEAMNMDPQERLFMQATWSAMENAGYTRASLKQRFQGRVGMFAGITRAGYNLYRNTGDRGDKFWPRTSFSSVANRLSYHLDLHGPSLPVDTMCSSSLTAIHEACEHIHNGDCDAAFAGGVNLYLHPTSYIDMSSQHMLSKDGACKSFGQGANGFVPGEGVGVVLLKPLDRAVADGDLIHGVILSTHVNHGGKTNGYTVPNPVAQAELVRAAIDKAGISARDISYIEAHGTGTELGDPIEVAGLQQAFAADTDDTGWCRLGSLKSNLGHLEAAAGIAGLTKVLLQLKHAQIVPTLHAATPNPNLRLDSTPFVLNRSLADWERPTVGGVRQPRIAGISSFGAGGANAHVIVQEYVPPAPPSRPSSPDANLPAAVLLSAKGPEQLRQKAAELLELLRTRDVALPDLAHTLQAGREAMELRIGFEVRSLPELADRLQACEAGRDTIDGARRGQVLRNKGAAASAGVDDEIARLLAVPPSRRSLLPLIALWAGGATVDWARLDGERPPKRIELPTYPFARDRYWIDRLDARRPHATAPTGLAVIEDILDRLDGNALDAARGVALLKQLV